MKPLTIIFTLFIGFLILEPTVATLDQSMSIESCDDDGECNDICNPFLSCATCLGFTPSIIANTVNPHEFIEPQLTGYTQAPPIQQIFDIFHPPKLA